MLYRTRTYMDAPNNRLVFLGKAATANYWDSLWETIADADALVRRGAADPLIRFVTKKYLPPTKSTRILEGGCGIGHHVAGLHQLGYTAIGVDYAERTVKKINEVFPELDIRQADVRALPFPDNSFDGYWSLGVIEHFFDGFEAITSEMTRVIRPGGYLFITFPYLSPLRRWKMRRNLYPTFSDKKDFKQADFYQFALDHTAVLKHFTDKGFSLIETKAINGIKGLKEEVVTVRPILQYIIDSPLLPLRALKVGLSAALEPVAGHTILLVLRKDPEET